MKLKYYFISFLTVSALISCSKDDVPEIPDDSATFSLAVESKYMAKADAGTVNPKDRITKLSVIVYIGDEFYTMKDSVLSADKLDDLHYTVDRVANIPVKSGNVKVLVVANAKNSGDFKKTEYKTLDAARTMIQTSGLADETHNNLTMSSDVMSVTLKVSAHNYLGLSAPAGATGDTYVCSTSPAKLYRNVARIQLTSLAVKKDTDYGTAEKFVLKDIFVANVKSKSCLVSKANSTSDNNWGSVEFTPASATEPEFWWHGLTEDEYEHKGGKNMVPSGSTMAARKSWLRYVFPESTPSPWSADYIYHDENVKTMPGIITIWGDGMYYPGQTQNENLPIGNFFYAYENSYQGGVKTYLVLHGEYTYTLSSSSQPITKDCYYYVAINDVEGNEASGVATHTGIKRNTVYNVQLTISGPGSEVIDPSDRANIAAKVVVKDWDSISINQKVD